MLCAAAAPLFTMAQGNVSGLIKSGPGDATKLSNAYLQPLFKGVGIGLNTGWNTSAQTKNLGKFDIRIGGSLALVPQAGRSFDVTTLGLSSSVRLVNNSSPVTPTAMGGKTSTTELAIIDSEGQEADRFTMPGGSGLNFAPVPEIQATVGLIKNTDVSVRFTPTINLGEDLGKAGTFGFGLKHDIMQHFVKGVAGKLVPFDLSLAFAYSRLNYEQNLDVPAPSNSQPVNSQQNTDFSNQKIEGHVSAINIELIASKRLLAFTPFVSVGWNNARTDVGLKGNYPIITDANLLGQQFYTTFNNPVTIKETSYSGLRGNLGFQVQVVFFRFFASYTIADYQAVNAGIGFGIGK